jgi:hypothetical protein
MALLLDHPLFRVRQELLSTERRINLSYARAVLIGKTVRISFLSLVLLPPSIPPSHYYVNNELAYKIIILIRHYSTRLCFFHDKFWELSKHPILALDGAVTVITSIHYNLCLTTIGKYAKYVFYFHSSLLTFIISSFA